MSADSLADPFDRTLARWAIGELASPLALRDLCACVRDSGAACGVVVPDDDVELYGAEMESEQTRTLFAVIARRSDARRAYGTPNDSQWKRLFGDPAHVDARWYAAEPL